MEKVNNQPESINLPVVTAIITNYNYGKWLDDAINSVLDQNYPNLQLAVYDDASTDNSVSILSKRFKETVNDEIKTGVLLDGKIKGMAMANFNNKSSTPKGPSYGRNQLIKAMWDSTDLFAILDADDMWHPEKISQSVMPFLLYPDKIGAVYTDNVSLNVHNNNKVREYRESFHFQRLLNHNMVHSGCVISKLALSQVGLYDESMRVAEDYDLWIRIAEKMLIYHVPEPLVTIRVGSHNTGNSIPMEIWQKHWNYIRQKIQSRQQNA